MPEEASLLAPHAFMIKMRKAGSLSLSRSALAGEHADHQVYAIQPPLVNLAIWRPMWIIVRSVGRGNRLEGHHSRRPCSAARPAPRAHDPMTRGRRLAVGAREVLHQPRFVVQLDCPGVHVPTEYSKSSIGPSA